MKKNRMCLVPVLGLLLLAGCGKPSALKERTVASLDLVLLEVPAGRFLMGAPLSEPDREDDEAQHEVKISKPFWLGKTEVTQAQWVAVMGDNPSHFTGDPRRPVEKVSWDDAMAFCRKLT